MMKDKGLVDYSNSFSPKKNKKNDKRTDWGTSVDIFNFCILTST